MHSHCEVAYCLGGSGEPMHEPTTHRRFDWVIVGGESGPGARPFHTGWARSIIAQCAESKTACFVKQLGARPLCTGEGIYSPQGVPMTLADPKGGDMAEWPADLRVRQWPAQVPRVERVGRGACGGRIRPHDVQMSDLPPSCETCRETRLWRAIEQWEPDDEAE